MTVTPGLSVVNCSFSAPMTLSIEVEPLVDTEPERAVLSSVLGVSLPFWPQPARMPSAMTMHRAMERNLFIFSESPFDSRFGISLVQLIAYRADVKGKRCVL